MQPKNRLQLAPFDDVKIIGINTSLVDYKMAWRLNKQLNINLSRFVDIVIDNYEYSFFYYSAGENYNVFDLVAMRRQDKTWLRLSPRVDYLFIIRNDIDEERLSTIIRNTREVEGVMHAFLIDTTKDNTIEAYLELLELHEIAIQNKLSPRKTLAEWRMEVMEKRSSLTKCQTAY